MPNGIARLRFDSGFFASLALGWIAGCAADPASPPGTPRDASSGSAPSRAAAIAPPHEALASAFLSNPDYEKPCLSPDGSRLAAIRSHGAEDRIVVRSLDAPDREPAVAVREDRGEGEYRASRAITMLGWAGDEYLVYAIETALRSPEDGVPQRRARVQRATRQRQRGVGMRARKTRLYSVSLDGRSRYLGKRWQDAPYSQFQDDVIDFLPNDPGYVLLAFEGKAVRVNVKNGGRLMLVHGLEKTSTWASDHTGTVRVGLSARGWDRHIALHARRSELDPWRTLIDYDAWARRGFWFAGFSPDPSRLFVFSDLESDRTALYEYDLERRSLGPPIAAEATQGGNVVGIVQSAIDDRLLAVEYCRDRCARAFVDPEFASAWQRVESAFPGRGIDILGRSRAEDRWLLQVSSDASAPELWLAELPAGRVEKLADLHPTLAGRELAPMQTVRFRARDGLVIEGYLTRPKGVTGSGPVIVFPHDGPQKRADWGFDPVVQHLVARGFSVYQPNYRGSTGYGRELEMRGHGEWGGAIVHDVIDGARALVASGWADPERLGIYGEGFGGYLALQALVEAPALFAAGASLGAVTDLPLMLADDRYVIGRRPVDELLVLPASGDAGELAAASPVNGAERIRAPILLGHGTQDPRFPEKHSEAMAAALRRAGRPVESLRYEGDTDEFLDDRHRIDFHLRLADFFERHLAGQSVAVR